MTLVLLHGFTGRPESWNGVLAELPGKDAYCPRIFGHDAELDAALGDGRPSFVDEVDRLADDLARRRIERAHLCGYSMGARLALGLLVRHPARFARATLMGANPGLPDEAARAERRRADDRWVQLLVERGLDAFVAAWEAQPLFAAEAALPEPVRAAARALRREHCPVGLALALGALGLGQMPDWTESLRQIAAPVHLVAGGLDDKFRALSSRLAEALPRAAFTVVDGAGHNLPLERPREVAAAIIQTEEVT